MSQDKYKNTGHPEVRAVEEMGELLQAIGKMHRFGKFSHHPDRKTPNIVETISECEDVLETVKAYKLLLESEL